MRYYETNFHIWERPLINQLIKEGYFIYGIRDGEGIHYTIEPWVIADKIGFLVTDEEIVFDSEDSWQHITDTQLMSLGKESPRIGDEIRVIADKISDELALSKARWEQAEAEREKAWKDALKIQDNRMERDRHYRLSLRKDNPAILSDGNKVTFQTIYNKGNGIQEVMYFIRDDKDRITTNSTTIETKFNARYATMVNQIAKKHGLAV